MIKMDWGLPLFLLVVLLGILGVIITACVSRNAQAETAPTQECSVVKVSDAGGFNITKIKCPERTYRCFRYTHSSSISCVPLVH